MKDAYYLNAITQQVRKAEHNPSIELFTYQMPTVYDEQTNSVFTADWHKMKIVSYNQRGNWQIIKDLKQVDFWAANSSWGNHIQHIIINTVQGISTFNFDFWFILQIISLKLL